MSEIKVKVCGLTCLEDAQAASDHGAWALGFIFYPESPRAVTRDHVRMILSQLEHTHRGYSPKTVGVFVNESVSVIVDHATSLRLNFIQLHGDESPEFCQDLREQLPHTGIIKALRLHSAAHLDVIATYAMCEAILLDTFVPAMMGGTGQLNDLDLIRQATRQSQNIIFAGGLSAENVSHVLKTVKPYALDVSSGLERSPGKKDGTKMKLFFERVRNPQC